MEAKEKANEMVEKYYQAIKDVLDVNNAFYYSQQCALIAVGNEYKSLREMLFNLKACKVIESDGVYLNHIQNLIEEEKKVKQEIEKL